MKYISEQCQRQFYEKSNVFLKKITSIMELDTNDAKKLIKVDELCVLKSKRILLLIWCKQGE